ncbi:MAG: hypothetical protein ACUZ8O_17075 [Candidatus Anammoxibacter sp.]
MGNGWSIYLAGDNSGISSKKLDKYFEEISGAGITIRYNYICGKLAETEI